MELQTPINVIVHGVIQCCNFSNLHIFYSILTNVKRFMLISQIMLISKANPRLYFAKGFLVDYHANRLHFWLYSLVVAIVVVFFKSLRTVDPNFRHFSRMARVKPFRPKKIGLSGFVIQMPPPSLLEQFLHEHAIVTLLHIGVEGGLWVTD